jgi:putative Mg2+ transporter-C (MgtC) family protein
MSGLWAEVFHDLADEELLLRAAVRLPVAVVLGAVIGLERQAEGKPTSARMHMIVALGAALFTLTGTAGGISSGSRVMQGVVTGIGFLGGGVILRELEQHRVRGLTTAASVWLTAAVGMSIGAGYLWPAVLAVVLGWLILSFIRHDPNHLLVVRPPPRTCEPPPGEGQ